MKCVLGIDGGGTRTRAWLVNERGDLLGAGTAGGSNVASVGVDAAFDSVVLAVSEAIAHVDHASSEELHVAQSIHLKQQPTLAKIDGLTTKLDVAGIVVGLAGIAEGGPCELLVQKLGARLQIEPSYIDVIQDAQIALQGALLDEPGGVLIAGTGAICMARDSNNELFRAGGYGYFFDDKGSAFDIGKHAIESVIQSGDHRGDATLLREMIFAEMSSVHAAQKSEPLLRDWLIRVQSADDVQTRVAALAALVFSAAQQGDRVAESIVSNACLQLAALVVAATSQLCNRDNIVQVRVAIAGGLAKPGVMDVDRLQPMVDGLLSKSAASPLAFDTRKSSIHLCWPVCLPVVGAVMLAMKKAGVEVTQEIVSKLQASSFGLENDDTA
jgi:N-acetylglucosamine kinase-like BadF-type ATPase